MADYIDRQAAIDALWKALWKYEDDSELAFQTHEELDIGEWFQHRIFVQRMSDIDRQTIIDMPAADVEPVVRCKDCIFGHKYFDVINGMTDSWVECRNPNGLKRDVSFDGYCSEGIKDDRKTNEIKK